MAALFVALVHHPVLNRRGEVVATAITNVDLHDLARAGRTYGVKAVFVVTPVVLQQRMVEEVMAHWTRGDGAHHERRAAAMALVRPSPSLADACSQVAAITGETPTIAVTGAQLRPTHAWDALRAWLADPAKPPILLTFGTGWGLAPEVVDAATVRMSPLGRAEEFASLDADVEPLPPYNHLSVRAAVAIALDRLTGCR